VVANSGGTTEYQFNQFFVNTTGGAQSTVLTERCDAERDRLGRPRGDCAWAPQTRSRPVIKCADLHDSAVRRCYSARSASHTKPAPAIASEPPATPMRW
jgi:hypothetical protein